MKLLKIFLLAGISISLSFGSAFAKKYTAKTVFTEKKPFIILNFDDKAEVNTVGGQFGAFDADPNDSNAYIRYKFKKDKTLHNKGYNLYVKYDVDSPKTAFNGIWTKLNNINIKKFNAFTITIKGDSKAKFNSFFKIEVKTTKGLISATVDGITDKWQKIVIPFEDFDGDVDEFDFSRISEFTIVFEDWKFKEKVGAYYIDDIGFIPKKGVKVKFSEIRR